MQVYSGNRLSDRNPTLDGVLGYKRIPSGYDFTIIPASYNNSILEISYKHDLGGQTITLPQGVKLLFNGGLFYNGTINFNDNHVYFVDYQIFDSVTKGTGTVTFERACPENWGAIGDNVTDDRDAFNDAVQFLGDNSILYLLKKLYLIGSSITIDKYIQFKGENVKSNRFTTGIRTTMTNGNLFLVTNSLFQCSGIDFIGSSDVAFRGSDITTVLFSLTATLGGANVDAQFFNCGFIFWNKVFDLRGRNLIVSDCVFSNSQYAFHVSVTGVTDFRGLESYNNRYHSIGNLGDASSVFYFNPASNFFDVTISGYCDDCANFYTGFSGETLIDGVLCTKLDEQFLNVDASGCSLTFNRRNLQVSDCNVHVYDPTLTNKDCVSISGPAHFIINDNYINRSGGNGIYLNTPYVICNGNTVNNSGGYAAATYYAFYLTSLADHCIIKNNVIKEDVNVVESGNNTLGGFYIAGDECILSSNDCLGFDGKEMTLGASVRFYGEQLKRAKHRISYASAMPVTGNHIIGDIVYNTNPVKDANNMVLFGWKRLTTSSANVLGTDWANVYISHVSPAN